MWYEKGYKGGDRLAMFVCNDEDSFARQLVHSSGGNDVSSASVSCHPEHISKEPVPENLLLDPVFIEMIERELRQSDDVHCAHLTTVEPSTENHLSA